MFWGNILIKKSKFYKGPSFPRDVITSPLKEIGVWQQKMSTFVCTFKLYCGLASFISIYRYFVFTLYECYFWLLNKRSFQWWWMFYYTFNFVFVNSASTNANISLLWNKYIYNWKICQQKCICYKKNVYVQAYTYTKMYICFTLFLFYYQCDSLHKM